VIEPAVSPLPTTHTSTGPPASSIAPAVQKLRPSRMRGWLSGCPGSRSDGPGPGQDQPVALEGEPPTRSHLRGLQVPAAFGELDAVDLGVDRLDAKLLGDPPEVPVPLPVVGAGLAAVDPVGQAALVDQVALPRPAARPIADVPGGRTPAERVGIADVLFGRRAEGLTAVGVSRRTRPVGGDLGAVDHDQVGHLPAGLEQGRTLGRDGKPLGPSPR
jgi:hypothetical protein